MGKRPMVSTARLWQFIGVGALAAATIVLVAFALLPRSSPVSTAQPTPVNTPTSVPTPTPAPVETLTVPRDADGTARVLFTGDSLTGAYFSTTEAQGFRSLMIAALGPVEETTATLAGQTLSTVSNVTEVPADLDLAVVELGTNDAGIPTPLDEFAQQYAALIERIRTSSPSAALLCAGTWTDAGADYDRIISEQCASAGGLYVPLADLYLDPANHGPEGVETFVGVSDYFHPNDAGHAAIAAALLAGLTY